MKKLFSSFFKKKDFLEKILISKPHFFISFNQALIPNKKEDVDINLVRKDSSNFNFSLI